MTSWIRVTQHGLEPLSWWYNEHRRERLDMEPGYQRRGNLWSRWKKAHLIDSIINGFDIPKFYVADFNTGINTELNERKKPYAVIDGKQRFEAIFSFFEGSLKLNPSARYFAESERQIGGLSYQDLQRRHPSIARRLDEYVPVVMSVAAASRGMIEQMFIRLNSGVPANGAERRNAMPGPVPRILREITVHPFFAEAVRFNKNRMQEFNLAAKILMFEFNNGFGDTKARNLDDFVERAYEATKESEAALEVATEAEASIVEETLRELEAPYRDAEQHVMDTLDKMFGVFRSNDPLLTKQGAIPVYYWGFRTEQFGVDFRDFLTEFEPLVLHNVRIARESPEDADGELLAYYNASRTSNDRASMRQRLEILIARYKSWAE